MKLCWTRMTQSVNIDPASIEGSFADERFALFKKLIERGHRVKIIAPFVKASEQLYRDVKAKKISHVNGIDVSWISKLEYKPKELPDNDDVLFVEHGPANVMFAGKYLDGLPMFRFVEACRKHKGLIILFHADPDLPFPIWKITHSKIQWDDPKNAYNIETKNNTWADGKYGFKKHDNLEDHGWGNYADLFGKGKKVVVLSKSTDAMTMINEYEGSRSGYSTLCKKGLITIEGLPTAYTTIFMPKAKFNENPEYDICYAGYPRYREKSFMEFLWDLPSSLRIVTFGPWNEKKKKLMLHNKNFTCLGKLKGLKAVVNTVNNSKAVMQLGTNRAKKYKFVTGRHFEAVFSGAVCLYDASFTSMEQFLSKPFAVCNKDEAKRKFICISEMDVEQRRLLWQYQYELCKNYTFSWYVSNFEKLCAKYGATDDYKPYKFKKLYISDEMKYAVHLFLQDAKRLDIKNYNTSKLR